MAGDEEIKAALASGKMPEEIDVVVVNMDKVLYEGKAKSIIAPGPFGNFGILPGHTPIFIQLLKGKISIDVEGAIKEFDIDGGLAKITQFKVIILVGF